MTRSNTPNAEVRVATLPAARVTAGRVMLPVLAAVALSMAAPGVADAQAWRAPQTQGQGQWVSINARQASLVHRIDVGVRNGQLNRREATRLKAEFSALARLEAQYRRGGLTRWERTDLDRRFDRLAAQVRFERRDHQRARW